MPGIDILFRSLGTISGNYGFTIYGGPVRIEALENLNNVLGDQLILFLNSGESTWIIFSLMSLKAELS